MEKAAIELFSGKRVKLALKANDGVFLIIGKLENVFSDCVQFTTLEKTSIIDFSRILEISEEKEE